MPGTVGHASLTIERAGGRAAAELGIVAEPGATWEADGSDTVAFGGTLAWTPSQLSAGLAIAPALAETGALSIEDALQRLYECPLVAAALTETTTQNGCDATCLEALCRTGMASLWDRVESFSGSELERLELTAVGDATVGEEAQATALVARWVGRLASAPSASTGGDLRAWAARVTTR
jgi:hypothetical protein